MATRLRLYLRTGLIAVGVLFGPDLLFGVLAATIRLTRTSSWEQFAIVAPLMLAMIACALWALVAGHWYVRPWFMVLSVAWNLWAMLDMFKRAQTPWELPFALPWFIWTIWFSFRLVEYDEQRKALTSS